MIDPVSAMATATAAFNALKKGVEFGRDIESMAGDIGRWMSCLSDVEQAEKEAKNPPIFKKIVNSKSVEAEALELFMTKRKMQQQRDELRNLISWSAGPSAWDELVKTEVRIRKERQETLYKQREKRRHFVEVVTIVLLVSLGAAAIVGFIIFLMNFKG
jgi:hypothetical protein